MTNDYFMLTEHELLEFGTSLFSEGWWVAKNGNPFPSDAYGTTHRDNAVHRAWKKLQENRLKRTN